jgi:ATP-dependent Clp protease ATP-binding subunit ClpA
MASPGGPVEDIFGPDGRLRPDLLTEPALAALREALSQARETRWDSVRSPHVFMGLLAVPDAGIRNWRERLDEAVGQILDLEEFQELFRQDPVETDIILALNREFLSDNVIRLLRDARERATSHQRSRITTMDLLINMLTSPNSIVAECFERAGVTAAKLTELAVLAEYHTGPG